MKYDKGAYRGEKTPFTLKVIKKKVPFNEEGKRDMYCLRPAYNKVKEFKDLARDYIRLMGVNEHMAVAFSSMLCDGICHLIDTGYAVNIGDVGTLKPVVNSKAHVNPSDCSVDDVKRIKLQFFPCKKLNKTLGSVALRINNKREMVEKWKNERKE